MTLKQLDESRIDFWEPPREVNSFEAEIVEDVAHKMEYRAGTLLVECIFRHYAISQPWAIIGTDSDLDDGVKLSVWEDQLADESSGDFLNRLGLLEQGFESTGLYLYVLTKLRHSHCPIETEINHAGVYDIDPE